MMYFLPKEVVRIKLMFVIHKTHSKKQYSMIKPVLLFFSHIFGLTPYLICDIMYVSRTYLYFSIFLFSSTLSASQNVKLCNSSFLDSGTQS